MLLWPLSPKTTRGLYSQQGPLSPFPSAFVVYHPAAGQANMTLPIAQVCHMLLFLAGGFFFPYSGNFP